MLTSRPWLEVVAAGPCDSALSAAYRKYRARTAERAPGGGVGLYLTAQRGSGPPL